MFRNAKHNCGAALGGIMLEGGPEILRSLGCLDLPSENRPHSLTFYVDR
jgi:hypothetical protein